MLRSQVDHIVIAASSLASGVEYIRRSLGAEPESGGQHPKMGTHNALLRLGEETYLEVIAINPTAERPESPVWFELDQVDSGRQPGLSTWVARTNDIRAAVLASPVPLGIIEPMSRGRFKWLITIPPDGSLPLHGVAPVLIQWLDEVQPVVGLRDSGCSLLHIHGFHPEAKTINQMLASIGFEGNVVISPLGEKSQPCMEVFIQTPHGERRLRTSLQ